MLLEALEFTQNSIQSAYLNWRTCVEKTWNVKILSSVDYLFEKPGKCIRPYFLSLIYSIEKKEKRQDFWLNKDHAQLALALEFVHVFSLVHDDLPCMDNDEFRRGRKTLHALWGEAHALLVGDALLNEVYSMLAQLNLESEVKLKTIQAFSVAVGPAGLIGGQQFDIDEVESGKINNIEFLEQIHRQKTGALFQLALKIALMLQSQESLKKEEWANGLGFYFQVQDDALDSGPVEKILGAREAKSFKRKLYEKTLNEAGQLWSSAAPQEFFREMSQRKA